MDQLMEGIIKHTGKIEIDPVEPINLAKFDGVCKINHYETKSNYNISLTNLRDSREFVQLTYENFSMLLNHIKLLEDKVNELIALNKSF
jgi:hypothetical protein